MPITETSPRVGSTLKVPLKSEPSAREKLRFAFDPTSSSVAATWKKLNPPVAFSPTLAE